MTPPTDIEQVIHAFRLGWTLAELRGRYRPGLVLVCEPPGGMRTDHALPLADERSVDEQLIELHGVLNELAGKLAVDANIKVPGVGEQSYSLCFGQLGSQLRAKPTHEVWEQLTELAYSWDAYIQDTLVITASIAAAYQLGRGLAETYWALDPKIDDPKDWRSWHFLLGEHRCRTLGRLATRLVDYVDPLTVPAITSSLNAWAAVAADPDRRQAPATIASLYDQGVLWRDLFRGERRPEDLAATQRPIRRFGLVLPVLRAFYVQIIFGLIAAGLLAFSGAELAAGSATKTNTFIAVLSGLGITSAGAYARAKGMATSLIDHLRTAFERDRVGVAATLAPPPSRSLTAPLKGRSQLQIDSASPRISAPRADATPTPTPTAVAH